MTTTTNKNKKRGVGAKGCGVCVCVCVWVTRGLTKKTLKRKPAYRAGDEKFADLVTEVGEAVVEHSHAPRFLEIAAHAKTERTMNNLGTTISS